MTLPVALATAALNPIVGLDRLERLLELWPVAEPGVEARYFSSFDRTGGNDDGFSGKHSALYTDHRGEQVIFDAEQPGCLYTLWFTSDTDGHGKLNWGRIRFYFDGEATPRLDMDANELFDGGHAPFLTPLVANNRVSTGGFVSYLPMPFAKSLRITTERRCGFYNAFYHLYPCGAQIATWTGKEDSSKVRKLWTDAMAGRPRGLPGKRQAVAGSTWSHDGPGVITRLAVIADDGFAEDARIVCEWDGQVAIDAPLLAFFHQPLCGGTVRSLAFFADSRKLVCLLPMPFGRSAKVSVVSAKRVDLQVDMGTGRYESRLRMEGKFPPTITKAGEDFEHVHLLGAGNVVGVVQAIRPGAAANKQWWEGDLRVYVDGAGNPAMHGTGHEDDFLGGWSNEFLDAPFTLPMHGEPYVKMLDRTGQFNGDCALYRHFVGVPFLSELRWSTEHGTENRHNFEYGGAVLYYSWPLRMEETDEFVLADHASRETHSANLRNVSEGEALVSEFEGRWCATRVKDTVYSSLGKTEFDLRIDPANQGVKLRRRFDHFHGRQRARVLVDGQLVGTWFTVEENTAHRWAERDFFLPERYTNGKSRIRITIDPPASSPLFSHARYWALCLLPGGR